MSERYIKVFSGNEDLYVDDAPIMIRASALLKDTLTSKMIAQLKFQNISDNNITYIKVRITQLDAINQQIDTPIDFEYLDILVSAKEEFGSRTPIILSNPAARAFKVGVSCVGFSDGTVWKCENSDWVPALMESPVMKKLAAEETYQDAKTLLAYNTRESLTRAKELFESISIIKDVTVEIGSCNDRILEFDIEEEKKKEKKKQKKKKSKKIAILISSSSVALALLGYFLIYPFISLWSGNYSAYINVYGISDFTVPNGVTTFSPTNVIKSKRLNSVTFPDSVTDIDRYSLADCNNLKYIYLGSNVRNMAHFVCPWGLTTIDVSENNSYYKSIDGVLYSKDGSDIVIYPTGRAQVSYVIFDGTNTIKSGAFDSSTLTSLEIPKSVTNIEASAINCRMIREIKYNGTIEDWEKITKHPYWSSGKSKINILCTNGNITK